MGAFSEQLVRQRRGAGFPTAYRFFHSNGGRRTFPFTYVHYLRLEKGVSVPQARWLPVLLAALRLSPGDPGSRAFHLAFLKDLVGGQETFDAVVAPLLSGKASPSPPGLEALRWMKAHHVVHLTPAQFKALAGDETLYWCSELLLNDDGALTARAAAETLGLAAAEARRALKALERLGLARAAGKDAWRARQPGKLYTFPGRLAGMGGHLDRIRRYWESMRRRRGKEAFDRVELVRAEEPAMRRYAATLAEALDAANAFSVRSAGDGSGLFLVEARVRKLLPF